MPEPLSYTVVDSVVVVRTCIPLTITSQSVSVYSGEKDYEGNEVWSTSGSIKLPAGSEFAAGTPLPGFTEIAPLDIDMTSTQFKLEMDVETRRGGSWSTFSFFEAGQLVEGEWVDSYGETQDTPCTHEPCAPQAACYNDWPEPTGFPTNSRPTFTPAEESPAE